MITRDGPSTTMLNGASGVPSVTPNTPLTIGRTSSVENSGEYTVTGNVVILTKFLSLTDFRQWLYWKLSKWPRSFWQLPVQRLTDTGRVLYMRQKLQNLRELMLMSMHFFRYQTAAEAYDAAYAYSGVGNGAITLRNPQCQQYTAMTMDRCWTRKEDFCDHSNDIYVVCDSKLIIVTWHQHNGAWDQRQVGCLFSSLFWQTSKKILSSTWPAICDGDPPMTSGLPSQRVSNTEKVFMS